MEDYFSVNKFTCKKQPLEETMTWVRIVSIVVVYSLSHVWLCNPMDCSLLGSFVMGFSRPEYWSGLPFPSPGHLPDPGIEPGSPVLHADFLLTELWGKRPWALRAAMREVSLSVHCSNSEIPGHVWQLQGGDLNSYLNKHLHESLGAWSWRRVQGASLCNYVSCPLTLCLTLMMGMSPFGVVFNLGLCKTLGYSQYH